MDLNIKEVNYYSELVKNNKVPKIECQFDSNDTVVSKVDSSDKVYFYCLGCQTSFYPGINLIEKIKGYISIFS
jgi:hypothetical protein